MSDALQDLSPPEMQAKAAAMGWIAPEHYRGDPERFITAEEYIRRGEEVIPIIRANAKKLEEKLEASARKNAELESALREVNANMAEFTQAQKEMMKERLDAQRRELLAERKQAREEGNDELLDDVESRLDENRDAKAKLEATKPPAPEGTPGTVPQPTPEQQARYAAWVDRNPWFKGETDSDYMLAALAQRYGVEAVQKGKEGDAFFAYVDEKMTPHLRRAPAPDKTEGGGRGSGGGGGGGSRGYASLPPDARAQCDADERRFVGPNKVFKTSAEWRSHFASQYFGE